MSAKCQSWRVRVWGLVGFMMWGSVSVVYAQTSASRAVQLYAETQASPPQITLKWNTSPHDENLQYVYRRAPGATNWMYRGSDPAPGVTQWVDTSVVVGERYEYKVYRAYLGDYADYNARGYTIAGIDAALMDQRGTVILLIDSTKQAALAEEIDRFKLNLIGDGWNVVTETVAPSDTPPSVRTKLQAIYNADTNNVKAAILLGRIPVPYSGDIYPDGHTDHRGAWPADTYYADLTGTWTDDTVNVTVASQARNHNVPGDGKFDQSNLPSDANIAIGRIDMANLSGFEAGENETELLRNYLRKNHEFRHRLGAYAHVPKRGLIRDAFGVLSNKETPASMAWRGFVPMFGPANVAASGNWFPTVETNAYLWGYGGGGSGYSNIGGVGTSTDFKTKNSLVVFNAFFGSYFGDWDSPTDNALRAPLAGAEGSLGLVTFWATRPKWNVHGMTLGETIGDAYLRTVNNPNDWGENNWWVGYINWITSTPRMVHIALMGDPTLRLHPVAAPANGTYFRDGSAVQLEWQAPADEPGVGGYHVYRASDLHGTYTRLTASPVAATSYTDHSSPAGSVYQVRAVTLTESASGTYYNAGQALFVEEGPGMVEFTEAVYEVMEPVYTTNSESKTVTIGVRRVGGSVGEVSVAHVAAALETLSFAGENYSNIHQEYYSQARPSVSGSAGTLTWADGETGIKTFSFEIYADATWENFVGSSNPLVEGIESLFLFLGHTRGVALGENARARLDILDAEAPAGGQGVIQFDRPRFSAMENSGKMDVILRRVQGSTGSVSATFTTSSTRAPVPGVANPIIGATEGTDYTAINQVVTWADGDSADKVIEVQIHDNSTVQSGTDSRGVRGIRFQLSSPTGGAEVSVNESMGLIIDNESQTFDVWVGNLFGKKMSIRLPSNTDVARGLIHFMPGTGGDFRGLVGRASNQAVADQWGFAISGQLANGFAHNAPSGIAQFHNHMDALALFTGRDELRNAPVILTGYSAGGYNSLASYASVPEQMLGFVAHKGGDYEFNKGFSIYDTKPYIHETNLFTPGLIIAGGYDNTVEAKDLYDALVLYRTSLAPGAQMSTAMDWKVAHSDGGGQGWAMAYLFMDELIRLRYPQGQVPGTGFAETVDLIDLPHENLWLVEQVNEFQEDDRPDASAASANLHVRPAAGVSDPGDDGMVPSERIARAIQAFSSLHGTPYQNEVPFQSPLKITSHTTTHNQITSINLGDSTTVVVDPRGYLNFNRMDFYFNDMLVGTRSEAPWEVSFIPGNSGVGLLRVETSTSGAGEIRYAFETVLVKGEGDLEPAAPQILSQPQSQTVLSGDTVSFSVVASGYPTPSFQWRHGGVPLAGQNSAVLNLGAVTLEHAGNYDVVVSNSEGSVTSGIAILEVQATGSTLLVHDTFSGGGPTWGKTGGTFTTVTDSTLDPEAPHEVGEFVIGTANKDDYIFFSLPSEVSLEVGEALRLSFRLRHTGTPRDDASTTGFSLAHTPSASPWNNEANKEYWVRTSYGNASNLGSIRKTLGAQLLNTGTILQSDTSSVNAGTDPIAVWFEVTRIAEGQVRLRYRMNELSVQEMTDSTDIITAFNRVFFRFRTRTDAAEPAFRIDEVKVERIFADERPFSARINFINADGTGSTPTGWESDTGAVFGDRSNGLYYGWNADNSAQARLRSGWNSETVKEYSFNHMQLNGSFSWEIAVPNGMYDVHIVSGDSTAFDSTFKINVEDTLIVNGVPTTDSRWVTGAGRVVVADGRLTVTTATGASNNKICFIEIDSVDVVEATVTLGGLSQHYNATARSVTVTTDPPDLSVGVTYDGSVSAPVNAGSYEVIATITEMGYTGATTGTLAIAVAPLTVTADPKSKTAGEADPPLTWQITSGQLFGGDSLSGSLTRATGENVGTHAIQQGTLAASANYNLSFVGANLTILEAPEGALSLTFATGSVSEDTETVEVAVTRNTLAGDQIVLLHSSDARVIPPASVVIPDGQYSHSFTVTIGGPASETPVTLTATANAAKIGESFTGPVDSEVAGQNTGWGWGGAWVGVNASPVLVEPSLTYTQNGTIQASGTRAARLANAGSGGQAYRAFSEKYASGSVWVSTLLYRNSSNWNTQLIVRDNPGSGQWARVRYDGTSHWILEAGSEQVVQLLGANPSPTTFFVVMEFDFTARKVRAWMNPDVSGATPANALASGVVDMQSSFGGANRLDFLGHSNLDQFDEIRVANSFADLYTVETASDSVLIAAGSGGEPERVTLLQASFPNSTGGNVTVGTSMPGWAFHFSDTGAEVTNTGYSAGHPTAGVSNTQSHPDAYDGGTQGVAFMYHGTWPSTTAFMLWRELAEAIPQDTALRFAWYNLHQHASSKTRLAIQVNGQWYLSTTAFTSAEIGATADFSTKADTASVDFRTAASDWSAFSFTPGSAFTVVESPTPLSESLPAGDITALGLYNYAVSGDSAAGVSLDSFQILGPAPEGEPDLETPIVFFESTAELEQHFRVNHGTASTQATGGINDSGALVTTGNPQIVLRSRVFSPLDANALGVHVKIGEQANSGYDSVTAMLGWVTVHTMNYQGASADPNVYVAARVLNLSNNGGYRLEIVNKAAPGSEQSTVANGGTFSLTNGNWIYVRTRMAPGAGAGELDLVLEVYASDATGTVGELLQTLSSTVSNAAVASDTRLWAALRTRRDGNAAIMDNFAATAGESAPTPMRAFVMAGQSNAVGYRSNNRNALPEIIRNGVPGVRGAWLLGNKNGDTLVPHTSSGWGTLDVQTVSGPFHPNAEGFGPEITLARRLQLHYETDIALVKFAVNGASLAVNFDPENTGTSGYYDDMRDYLRARHTELETQEDREATWEAFFWLQGESDASANSPQPATADAYAANLAAFLGQVRTDLDTPDLFFVASHINPRTESFPATYVVSVNNALTAAAADPLARVSPVADLWPAAGDDLHFDSPQIMAIGERLADAYLKTSATVQLSDLTQTVDGSGKTPGVATTPVGLPVETRFDGAAAAPSSSARYEVLVRVVDETYAGFALGTFTLVTVEGFVDSTGNGVDDDWEWAVFGNLEDQPVVIDGQSYTRRQVFFWNLADPTNQIFRMDGFRFATVVGRNYQVQHRASFSEGDWGNSGAVLTGSGEQIELTDPAPGFYRVRVLLP